MYVPLHALGGLMYIGTDVHLTPNALQSGEAEILRVGLAVPKNGTKKPCFNLKKNDFNHLTYTP